MCFPLTSHPVVADSIGLILNCLKKFCQGFFWGVVFWLLILPPPSLLAQTKLAQTDAPIETLKDQQQQIDQQRSAIQQERNRVQGLEKSAQKQLTGIRRNIRVTADQIQRNEKKLQATQRSLQGLEIALNQAETAYQKKQSATVARLRFLQRQQRSEGWAVLLFLQSRNLNDFLDRRYQFKRIYQADRQLLASLQREADRLEHQRNQVEKTKTQITLITQELNAQKDNFEQQADYQKQVVERLRTNRRALEAAEAQLEQDSKSIGQLIQQRVAAERQRGGVVALGTGQFSYPSSAPITSSFGWRIHPVLGYQRFHAGIDFGGDYGSPIRAADRGVVILAGWYGGYGNAVIVDHGNGVTTLYGHASQLDVAEGQVVERGQPIAAIGSTGLSTGPHLHFEVRKDGEPIDPAAFF